MTKRLLTVDEKAEELGVTRQTLWRWRKEGIGPEHIAYGQYVRYVAEALLVEKAA